MVVYTMVEMAKAHGLHPYNYLQYLLDSRPGKDTTDAEFQDLAPWSEKARTECNKNQSKTLATLTSHVGVRVDVLGYPNIWRLPSITFSFFYLQPFSYLV